MPISSLASLCDQNSTKLNDFYHAPDFQTFVVCVEETLKERLIEISTIATSRADVTATSMLCDMTLSALLQTPK
jgi:hypothetical protein